MADLPTGTVTFLFTDIEGSTRLLQTLGERWPGILEDHNRLLREAIRGSGGIDVHTEGDSFFAVFRSAAASVSAAVAAQRALIGYLWPRDVTVRVRMGIHTGEGAVGGDDYVGLDVHRAARIAAAGHGGQVLISAATAELVRVDLPGDVGLRDLGEHRLKDLARPERIYQLTIDGLPGEFPHIRSLETPTNLPAQRTSFVGREREVAMVTDLLRGPGLLTLTGAGGSGKTRLALQAARELLHAYPDGVFFVDLAPITDPRLVPSSIADAIGVKAEGPRPVLDTLRGQLRDREVLLVLDNFEQVVEAASVASDLLDAAPRLRILVTSREPLHIAGEQELAVPPMALPDAQETRGPDDLMQCESVALFVERAAAVDARFRLTESNLQAVAELCHRLDGLPLAIELAASRVKLLSPGAILDRLGRRLDLLTGGPVDLPARQRTLREAIGWSHDLLEESERVALRRLSVFAGGWTLEGAEVVANPGGERGGDGLEVLSSLVDKSLVRRVPTGEGEVRFGMLEVIREFGAEQLESAAEDQETGDRYASFFLEAAEAAEPHFRGLERKRWLDQLELEHDNLRAALRRAIDASHADVGLRLVAALWRFWHLHGHLAEGRRWAEEVLALPGSSERSAERARAMTALGGLAYWMEDVPATRRAYEEALAMARELGDRRMEAEGIYNLAYVPAYEGDIPGAAKMIERAAAMFEELEMPRGTADCLWILGIVARLQGDIPRSRTLAEESLRLHRRAGDLFGVTDALHTLGRTALAEGDLDTAAESFLEALANDQQVGNRTGTAIVMDNLAAKASAEGRHLRALRLGGASEAIKESAGGHAPPPLIDLPDPREAADEALGEAAVVAAWEEGRAMTFEQAVAYARREA
ncbi:MAG: adenylate/guanylate cyclase domain-containing protein [Actinomycetota bacterium]